MTTIDRLKIEARQEALALAKDYCEFIFEKFPPETFSDTVSTTSPFQIPHKNTNTPAHQFVYEMISIADWLINLDGKE